MKIFQIGFNKCGTSTLHRYLLANGISSVHFDGGRLAQRIFTNLANGIPLLAGYEHFDAFTDMEFQDSCGVYLEAYKLFPFFAAQYPDAVFILNTRDREAWIQSRFNHKKESYVQDHMRHFDATSNEELANYWRADWGRHHLRVLEFFSGSPYRFFVCRIETDLPQLLSERLPELSLDESLFTLHNVTKERLQKAALKPDLRSQKAALQRRNRALKVPVGMGTRLNFYRRMLARVKARLYSTERGLPRRDKANPKVKEKIRTPGKGKPWRAPIALPVLNPIQERAGYLAAVLLAKDEGPYLEEWLEFHRLVGVEHVYIYDNGSSDNSKEVLRPFLQTGYVTRIPWTSFVQDGSPQRLAYAHALSNFGPAWRWMAFIDADEFLFPTEAHDLPSVLNHYEHLPAVAVYWKMFGFSGHVTGPAGLVIENFTRRAPFPPEPGVSHRLLNFKSIIDPSKVKAVVTPHAMMLDNELSGAYTEDGTFVSTSSHHSSHARTGQLSLNHYHTKSKEEFERKLSRGCSSGSSIEDHNKKLRKRVPLLEVETVEDKVIHRFLPELALRLALRRDADVKLATNGARDRSGSPFTDRRASTAESPSLARADSP